VTTIQQIGPQEAAGAEYILRISRLTVDKLGVKLYDKASAVVAELVANAWDADAAEVVVRIPLGTELARKDETKDRGYLIEVIDNGHGMTPDEARRDYLEVGRDRRTHTEQGTKSRERGRPVMGRKGIGKLAPFGICKIIEVISSGGEKTTEGYLTTHFTMRFEDIVKDSDTDVPLDSGELDGTYQPERGTTIRLSDFRPRKVPVRDVFFRQLGRRFALAEKSDFVVYVEDTRAETAEREVVPQLDVEVLEHTRLDLAPYAVEIKDDQGQTEQELPVSGWLALAREAYKDEEMTGVRIYARGKIVATTRDFEQPAGYTGEYAIRSYLVGEVHVEWLDEDDGEDLVRTDRQDILWDSELGDALREWGKERIVQLGNMAKEPRRKRVRDTFLERSQIAERAEDRFADKSIVDAAVELAQQIGGFAAEDELADDDYISDLTDVILSVAPHRALIDAFQEFSQLTLDSENPPTLESLVDLFSKTRIAELASYSQIAAERVRVIQELERLLYEQTSDEAALQRILTEGPWLIEPTWTVISQNQGLLTFKQAFEQFWKKRTGGEVELAIEYGKKRPDFVLVSVGGMLHIVEIKAPGHAFDDTDFERLHNYAEAFSEFGDKNKVVMSSFPEGWRIDLVADDVSLKDKIKKRAYDSLVQNGQLKQISWNDFAYRAKHAHEEFLSVQEKIRHFLQEEEAGDAAA
jgi:hypothetical protein